MKVLVSTVALIALALGSAPASASSYPLSEILDKAVAEKLAAQEIKTSDDLLKKAATAKDRRALARAAKLPAKKLYGWAKMCDLLRIKGVGPEMVKLLGLARVATVKQLKARKAEPLYKRLIAANKKKKITENPPSTEQLGAWIAQAKKLDIVLR
jgi:hypothetical protein